MLEPLADGIWTTVAPLKAMGVIPMTSRMTVIRLRDDDGGLLVLSPVRLSPDLHRGLTALGPVRHVVAPNRMHHMFCGDYRAAYPEARLYGAPGVAKKRPDLNLDEELGDAPPAAWAGEVDQALVGGIPILNEVVFLHRPSGSLVVTDTAANGTGEDPLALRVWSRLNGVYERLATPREIRLMCRDRKAARRSFDKVLGWGFDRVVVGHGAIVASGGKERARAAFAWAA